MSQRQLQAGPTRSFVDLDTPRMMSEVAKHLARARKAVAEIRGIEDSLQASGASGAELRMAMADTAALARTIARDVADAVLLLKGMVPLVEKYAEEERNALD